MSGCVRDKTERATEEVNEVADLYSDVTTIPWQPTRQPNGNRVVMENKGH